MVSDLPIDGWHDLGDEIERRLQPQLGVNIDAIIVAPGALDERTETLTSPKPKRFRDNRAGPDEPA